MEEQTAKTEVIEVEEMPSPEAPADEIQVEEPEATITEAEKPDAPLDPIIETGESETIPATQTGELSGNMTVERIGETTEAKDLAAGLSEGRSSGPVTLTPAKPRPPTPPKIMRANPKPAPTPGARPRDATSGNPPVEPKMTSEVRQIPKKGETKTEAKAMPKQPPPPPQSPRQREEALPAEAKASAYTATPEVVTTNPVIPDMNTNQPEGDHWVNYVGTGQDVRDSYPPQSSNQHNVSPTLTWQGKRRWEMATSLQGWLQGQRTNLERGLGCRQQWGMVV